MELTDKNLIRMGTTTIKLKGMDIKVEYKLHVMVFPDPEDPLGNPVEMFYLHVPRSNTCYMNKTEEKVFEDMHECFPEDFIRHYAVRLNESMGRDGGNEQG